MDREERQAGDVDSAGAPPALSSETPLSRRAFTRRLGVGSAAAAGFALAAPKISTIRYATHVVSGSGPPETTTTTTTLPNQFGHLTVSKHSPCVGDKVNIEADGFAPKTAVTLELDSSAHVIGVTTADDHGKIHVFIAFSKDGPTGTHTLIVTGVRDGGRRLTLSRTINIRTVEECNQEPEGSTTTAGPPTTKKNSTTSTSPTSTPTPTSVKAVGVTETPPPPKEPVLGGNALAFTGTDAIDLALIGGAAAIGGRALYGLARRGEDGDEDDE